MHTTKIINSSQFTFTVNGKHSTIEDIFPGFHAEDRIGIVVRRPGASIGASSLLMAAITRFYDFYRTELGEDADKLWIYPDYYVFHIERQHLDHYWLDVWPPNKEVIVEDDPEQILEAINDRGITRLIVEDIPATAAMFLRETVTTANLRLKSAIAYSPTGRVKNADVQIQNFSKAEQYVLASLKRTNGITMEMYQKLCQNRRGLQSGGCVKESYRRIEVVQSLNMLTDFSGPGPTTQHYLSLL